jgi:hypothetical protein
MLCHSHIFGRDTAVKLKSQPSRQTALDNTHLNHRPAEMNASIQVHNLPCKFVYQLFNGCNTCGPSNALPLHTQNRSVPITSIDIHLLGARRHAIRREVRTTTRQKLAAIGTKHALLNA